MDKLTIISGALFLAADIFAVVSLAMPDWIVSDIGGDTRLGLLWTCETLYNRSQVCYAPSLGGACLYIMAYARWVGFTAMVLFCLAAVVFPMGFYVEEIGGEPYQLPNSFQVGYSYIFFVLALWMTVVSELFAGKVCLPNF
ncbi:putative uncharacterized protein C16orf52-like A [Penaeus vannamei]|uniref:Uncharacterized protein n=1 Tax=Penaeus vannamei TaxID=6689 RepID=A0A3R7QNV2_PENVA|nr:putative uncharacterized protein C16orf52-like A [Penaeus vannamei]